MVGVPASHVSFRGGTCYMISLEEAQPGLKAISVTKQLVSLFS